MPTSNDLHIDQPMTEISIAYRPKGFIVTQLPIANVVKESDKYFIFSGEDWLRDDAGPRAPGTVGPVGDYSMSTGSYLCEQKSLTKWVPDEERANSDDPLRPDRNATEYATDKVLLRAELLAKAAIFTATNWDSNHRTTLAGADQWDDFAGSDPIEDVETAKETIHPKIGMPPTEYTVIMGQKVFNIAKRHPLLQAQLGSDERKILTAEQIANIFGVSRVLVGAASYNSAAEGGTASYSFIWDDKVWIGYMPDSAELETPSAYYTISWNPSSLPSPEGTMMTYIERVRQDKVNGHLENRDGFRASVNIACKVTSDISGYLYSDVLS